MADAPGWPGIEPRWTSSAKTGVGTALSAVGRVWFTISHGILNEVYYPRVDQACIRDFGLIVTDGAGFFAEEKRDCSAETTNLEDGVPAFQIVNTHIGGRFRITKRILTDPRHEVLLQQIRLEVLEGPPLRLFALLAPHLVNAGAHNTGWVGDYKGARMLFAERAGSRLALATDRAFLAASVGFVGVSDGWQMLHAHGHLADQYDRAADGNVALTAELNVAGDAPIRLALGFGRAATAEAAFHATAGLQTAFNSVAERYISGWRTWQAGLHTLDRRADGHNTYRISTTVLRCHESPTFPGGLIASLSIPWGGSKSDDDLGGYHLVWPRDLVQTAGGFLACGAFEEVRRVLRYLRAVQEADGSWPQNCWLDGMPYWHGLQLDECALPIVLVDLAYRQGALRLPQLEAYWPMVRAAAGFVVRRGPVTDQDRWEENAGYTPFTLAAEIAGLLAAADLAELHEAGETGTAMAAFLRDTADAWEAALDDWLYVADTDLAREVGVPGYYVRIAPPVAGEARAAIRSTVEVRNRDLLDAGIPAESLISTDTLALVRFGLRAPDDPRILASVRVIDHVLRKELPNGPGWRRYNGDGYGEHDDGSPFNGTGVGRVWPLLAGERALYELAAGRKAEAEHLLAVMEAASSHGRLLPEQIWDGPPMPERELLPGAPSGSAMPLVWAHAEHIKLLRSLADGAVFDLPPQPVRRYQREQRKPRVQPWRPDWRTETIAAGRVLRVDLPEPAVVAWSTDDWKTRTEVPTRDTGLGVHVAELPGGPSGGIVFTWRSVAGGGTGGEEVRVRVS
ncbi:MAG TPA: glucan 1,4-alpha-glucosidase [Acetobacteraceae bacterium]|nr:glucan 1,4-alpha-glucosidase [Acetobacteraceae bacterium]